MFFLLLSLRRVRKEGVVPASASTFCSTTHGTHIQNFSSCSRRDSHSLLSTSRPHKPFQPLCSLTCSPLTSTRVAVHLTRGDFIHLFLIFSLSSLYLPIRHLFSSNILPQPLAASLVVLVLFQTHQVSLSYHQVPFGHQICSFAKPSSASGADVTPVACSNN
jgi:hypothetical protein